jgi:uncharacterized membrane protein YoaK (UPF0700 family)
MRVSRRLNSNWQQRFSILGTLSRSLLALVAGFCDTATFIHMGGVFSAHVTGNFVLFAAALAQGIQGDDYLKIVTLPVFVTGVAFAMLVAGRYAAPRRKVKRILLVITLLLLVAAALAVTGSHELQDIRLGNVDVMITLLLVVAMAMQNSIHRFVAGPMTTVMTGTVMNTIASLMYRHVLRIETGPQKAPAPGVNPLMMIAAFALGCVIAGFLTVKFGLASVIVPAGLLCLVLALELRTPGANRALQAPKNDKLEHPII